MYIPKRKAGGLISIVAFLVLIYIIHILDSSPTAPAPKAIVVGWEKSAESATTKDSKLQDTNSENTAFPLDGLYIINQPSRTDRLVTTMKMFHHIKLRPTIVDGIDMLPYKNAKLRNPSWRAAMEAHRHAIRRIIVNEDKTGLVMEDDIDVDMEFKQQIQAVVDSLPDEWGIVFFGHCAEKEGVVVTNVTRHGRSLRIHESVNPYCGTAPFHYDRNGVCCKRAYCYRVA